ncbi:Lon protease [Pseudomonas amygdali pv. photiniae]|uniref:Lon protease n=1 Tax=Pseudomonas amygdali pv. photiniae TaxID=251724 RepID=A0A658KH46_PSEA0|nr:Lon protease [Pseudomonas amygdali pv. photiniae]
MKTTIELPLLPLRDVVVYPHMVIPLFVGREKSIEALEAAMTGDKQILLLAQRNPADDDPDEKALYNVGTIATVLQLLKLPDGTVKVLVEGEQRGSVERFIEVDGHYRADVALIDEVDAPDRESEVFVRSLLAQFEQYVQLGKKVPAEVLSSLNSIDEPGRLVDTMAAHMALKIEQKQEILEIIDLSARVEHVLALLDAEIDLLQVEKRIRGRVKKQMERSQREYYLNEQMKAIQKELGDGDEGHNEIEELKKRIDAAGLPKDALTKATAELNKLKQMSPMSAEATVVRSYIDWLVQVPWKAQSKVRLDLARAEAILDADHYGLDEVKERILEYLAVQKRVKKIRGPVLCLVGPPGVGKTSLAESIANATNRKFVRMALGGVRDEAEIRGHRRTYIGSMPGRLIQKMTKVGVRNPLFLLDEIDKMGQSYQGDPASALLETLDPEQNVEFLDHYLDLRLDLSKVLFVCTANTLDSIPGPLLDRMEVIRLSGYITEEKLAIAKRHLWPKQLEKAGVAKSKLSISDSALRAVIEGYAREAGVRHLEKQLGKLVRKAVVKLLDTPDSVIKIGPKDLEASLGMPVFRSEQVLSGTGVITGLAWTSMGGATLPIEATRIHTLNRGFKLTGQLGDVMKESAEIAYSYVSANLSKFGGDAKFFDEAFVHVHVPEGATPKDGPSAGVTMASALLSLARNQPPKKGVAMTGELTLTGHVLPIGGVREKVIAARRQKIHELILPEPNRGNFEELPDYLKEGITVHFAKRFADVVKVLF